MIEETNVSQNKFGRDFELTLNDDDDVVTMVVNGYSVAVRRGETGVLVSVFDDTPLERYKKVEVKEYDFKNLEGKFEED